MRCVLKSRGIRLTRIRFGLSNLKYNFKGLKSVKLGIQVFESENCMLFDPISPRSGVWGVGSILMEFQALEPILDYQNLKTKF